jgi:hypothetical protein
MGTEMATVMRTGEMPLTVTEPRILIMERTIFWFPTFIWEMGSIAKMTDSQALRPIMMIPLELTMKMELLLTPFSMSTEKQKSPL